MQYFVGERDHQFIALEGDVNLLGMKISPIPSI